MFIQQIVLITTAPFLRSTRYCCNKLRGFLSRLSPQSSKSRELKENITSQGNTASIPRQVRSDLSLLWVCRLPGSARPFKYWPPTIAATIYTLFTQRQRELVETCPCVPDRIGIWKCWFLWRRENRSTWRKTSRSKGAPPSLPRWWWWWWWWWWCSIVSHPDGISGTFVERRFLGRSLSFPGRARGSNHWHETTLTLSNPGLSCSKRG